MVTGWGRSLTLTKIFFRNIKLKHRLDYQSRDNWYYLKSETIQKDKFARVKYCQLKLFLRGFNSTYCFFWFWIASFAIRKSHLEWETKFLREIWPGNPKSLYISSPSSLCHNPETTRPRKGKCGAFFQFQSMNEVFWIWWLIYFFTLSLKIIINK